MTRFLNHPNIPFHALIEPAQDAIRSHLATSGSSAALIVHDWCMFGFNSHTAKQGRFKRTIKADVGYELGSALVVDAADGRPIGPMELRLRTATVMLSTRVRETTKPPGHVDELIEVMNEARRWDLGKTLIHVIDREADSVGHYRKWQSKGHQFLVRANQERYVLWNDREQHLSDVVAGLTREFQEVLLEDGKPEVVAIKGGTGRVCVAQTTVVLHRPASTKLPGKRTANGNKIKITLPGPSLPLRLVVTRVVDDDGEVLGEWCLLTNVMEKQADAATVGRWYAWRWRVETYHKLLKTAGQNAEEWQQETGEAFLARLCIASMACLTVWHLQRDTTEEASQLRKLLVRLSGRQMKHKVESTAPALLAGLERLLAIDDLLKSEDLDEILSLARRVLPTLFSSG